MDAESWHARTPIAGIFVSGKHSLAVVDTPWPHEDLYRCDHLVVRVLRYGL